MKLEKALEVLKDLEFCNYHKHCHYSNVITFDSTIKPKDYIKRTLELGHTMVFSTQHGSAIGYHEYYDLVNTVNSILKLLKENEREKALESCKSFKINIELFENNLKKNPNYKLKFGFGAEAYMVYSTTSEEKDRKNTHIIILAKNKQGFKDINKLTSKANTEGYYYRPRVSFEDLLTLDPKNVVITTACVGSFIGKYEKDIYTEMVEKLKNRFGKSFFLEVQYHKTEKQVEYNKTILHLSKEYGVDLIMGTDSHVIYPEQEKDRSALIYSKGVKYEDEDGWYLDFPDVITVFSRFSDQGVLSNEEIIKAIKNTQICLDFEEITLNKDVKLPTIYPMLSQEARDDLYKSIIMKEWNEYKKEVPVHLHDYYVEEIEKEMQAVIDTKMTDYFLLNEKIIKKGIEYGGKLSKTGRGSAVSFITNMLLGFTEVDRIAAKVTMFPSRFLSKTRILETKSLPDIDFNIANVDPFIKAQEEIMGNDHSYWMLAFGKLKEKSAFKIYAKANDINFELANNVTKQLTKYELEVKYADDDELEFIKVENFISPEYMDIYNESRKFQGVIDSISPSPCSHLLYDENISEDVGLMRVGKDNKNVICAMIDGGTSDAWKYLKNDLLTVSVWDINHRVLEKIGRTDLTINKLLKETDGNQLVWDIYKEKHVVGINQVEKQSTASKCSKYAPKNETELSMFVAARGIYL